MLDVARQDHPRGCGENRALQQVDTAERGSPPRMRGKPRVSVARGAEPRITPADAGKTYRFDFVVFNAQDHPRGCGENSIPRKGRSARLGSPPRMRGKHTLSDFCQHFSRITPADAGKTENISKM